MGRRMSREQLRARREQTRDRLLKAGREILTTEPIGAIGAHVRSIDVTKRANLSAGSLYYHWLNQDEYVFDLVEYVLAGIKNERAARANQAHEVFSAILDEGHSLPTAVHEAGNRVFQELLRDASVFLQMALWAAHRGDQDISSQLKEMYERVEACWIPKIDDAVRRQGRQWRPPFTARTFTSTLTALAEGLLLRAKVDPGAVSEFDHPEGKWSLFATATLALYLSSTAPAGHRHPESLQDIRDQITA